MKLNASVVGICGCAVGMLRTSMFLKIGSVSAPRNIVGASSDVDELKDVTTSK